jgi:Asp-tRNA(Asn)/Glu-tRNA(Gln) amidotransferase A subunit family amidase
MKNAIVLILALVALISCEEGKEDSSSLKKIISPASKLMGLEFTATEIDSMQAELQSHLESYQKIRKFELENSVPLQLVFDPRPVGFIMPTGEYINTWAIPTGVELPENRSDLAFYSIPQLASLIRSKKISSVELTKFFLERLNTYGDSLECIVSLTEERAMAQAARADRELAGGTYRGILHGIPFGVKDLFAVRDYKTTWGAMPFKDQVLEEEATIVAKLEEAGGVLVAKLTLGALAYGDVWFGGKTRNPWNTEQGSSGSSAGSASATAAGLVPFAIGTETWGSIVSPSTRCGVTGLRPTFGRVSRYGAMALSWSMDKVGPITRSALDAAIVFDAIRGSDGLDPSAVDAPFAYGQESPGNMKVGYIKAFFEADYSSGEFDMATLDILKKNGIELHEVIFPDDIPVNDLSLILTAEAAAAFDELTRSGNDDLMVRQTRNAWPNLFRAARFIPAVEYINANRIRVKLMEQIHELFREYDVIITPSYGGTQLLVTNLTGQPCVVVPNGFRENGSPVSISFLGNLYDEASPLGLAAFYQSLTDFHNRVPPVVKDKQAE